MLRYVSTFYALDERRYTVNIYDDTYTGQPSGLYMSTDPVRISESAQDLLTEPIMASSAVLTFISDTALEGLVVEDEMQCAVEVLADDRLVWHGYLNPEVRDDLLPSITSEVTLNATSTLGLMSTRKIDAEGEPLQSIAQYIVEALQACGNVLTDICLPSVAKITESDGYNSLWTLQAQRDNFYTREEVTSTDDEQYDEQSWADVLSNFLTLFGLTMYEDYASGCIMLLSRDADATYCRMTLEDFAAATGAESYALPDSADMASLPMWGTSHSTSTYAPAKKVRVVSNINTIEQDIISQDTLLYGRQVTRTDALFIANRYVNGEIREENYYYLYNSIPLPINNKLTAIAYATQTDQITGAAIIKQIGKVDESVATTYLADTLETSVDVFGNHPVKALNLGGTVPIWGTVGMRKKATEGTTIVEQSAKTLYIRNNTVPSYDGYNKPERVFLPAGTDLLRYIDNSFRIKGPVLLGLYARFRKPENGKRISPIKLTLKVGGKYWNGSSWQSTAVTFIPEYTYTDDNNWEIKDSDMQELLKLEYGEIKGLKMLRANDKYMQGLELIISVNDEWAKDATASEFVLYDLTFACSENTNNISKNQYTGEYDSNVDTIVYRDNGVGKDMDDISINVHSDQGYQQARSYLWQGEQTVSSLVYGGTTQIPEQWLANHLKSIYCRRRKRYKLTVEGIDYRTNTRYNYEGITYTTVARSVDPYNNTTNIVLERATKNANL